MGAKVFDESQSQWW